MEILYTLYTLNTNSILLYLKNPFNLFWSGGDISKKNQINTAQSI